MTKTEFQSFLAQSGLDSKPHQEEGVEWMLEREKTPWQKVRGGIIADEMGLGKTIMTIGTMMLNMVERTLIVLPLALLQQWDKEIQRTTGIRPLIYHGVIKQRTPLAMLEAASVVLTTYGEIQISTNELSPKVPSAIHRVEWGRVIFDEAHHLRNMKTNKFKGGCTIKAPIRWMVTGTPIQNRTTDFFALCHALGFEDSFYGTEMDAIVGHSMMRRTKKGVGIKISELHDTTIQVPWDSETEKMLAEDIHGPISGFGDSFLGFADGIESEVDDNRGRKMLLMLRARQMCVLPKMLEKKYHKYCDEGFISEDEEDDCKDALEKTSKLDVVTSTIIHRKGNTNRKLVFCHYHKEMDEIKKRCILAGMAVRTIDGRLKPKEKAVAMLAPWPEVMILQINTCCEGLNLQEFNEVYFVSPHWNPAVEDQAIARCHRIGQKKDVHIFRFNMEGLDESSMETSLDNYCKGVQKGKRELYVY